MSLSEDRIRELAEQCERADFKALLHDPRPDGRYDAKVIIAKFIRTAADEAARIEREACAKICHDIVTNRQKQADETRSSVYEAMACGAEECLAAIRERE